MEGGSLIGYERMEGQYLAEDPGDLHWQTRLLPQVQDLTPRNPPSANLVLKFP